MKAPSIVRAVAISALFLQLACGVSAGRAATPSLAFVPQQQHRGFATQTTSLVASSASIVDEIPSDATLDTKDDSGTNPESILEARNRLFALSKTLADNSPSGKFIARPADKIELQKAVNDLESLTTSSMGDGQEREMLLGDWTLIATASLPSSDIRRRIRGEKADDSDGGKKKSKKKGRLSMFGIDGANPLQKSIRRSISVTQRIRNVGTASEIDRVDNVIEITPLDTLEGILPADSKSPLFGVLGKLNVNPLGVKRGKVVLVHKAEVESVRPVLRTKIAWTSSVLNVAGTSQYLDPEGADVFGVNNLLGEFQGGTFDTPFVDGDIRVSRTSGPVLEQLRVFVREGSSILNDAEMMKSLTTEMRVEEEREVGSGDDTVATQVKKVVEAPDDVREAVSSMAENARTTIEKDMDDVSKALGDTMDDVAAKVQDAMEDDLEQIGKAVEGVQSALRDGDKGMEDVGEALTYVTKAVAKVPEDVRSIVEEDATGLGDRVDEALDAMVADVQDSVEGDLKYVGKSIEAARDTAAGVSDRDDEAEEETKEE